MAAAGIAAMAIGSLWDLAFPINKNLWTSSYAWFMGGAGAFGLAACYWVVDVKGWRWWTKPFVVLGVNAIALFVLAGLSAKTLLLVKVAAADGKTISLYGYIYRTVVRAVLGAEERVAAVRPELPGGAVRDSVGDVPAADLPEGLVPVLCYDAREESMTGPEAFGLELRRARERKGLTLEQVSEQTKVSVAHFAGLERGDISRWPAGIFGRAFVRGYGRRGGARSRGTRGGVRPAVPGIAGWAPAAPRPDRSQQKEVEPPDLPGIPADIEPEDSVLRLVLDSAAPAARPGRFESAASRVAAGLVDVLIPAAVAGGVAFVAGREWFWITAACVGDGGPRHGLRPDRIDPGHVALALPPGGRRRRASGLPVAAPIGDGDRAVGEAPRAAPSLVPPGVPRAPPAPLTRAMPPVSRRCSG